MLALKTLSLRMSARAVLCTRRSKMFQSQMVLALPWRANIVCKSFVIVIILLLHVLIIWRYFFHKNWPAHEISILVFVAYATMEHSDEPASAVSAEPSLLAGTHKIFQ